MGQFPADHLCRHACLELKKFGGNRDGVAGGINAHPMSVQEVGAASQCLNRVERTPGPVLITLDEYGVPAGGRGVVAEAGERFEVEAAGVWEHGKNISAEPHGVCQRHVAVAFARIKVAVCQHVGDTIAMGGEAAEQRNVASPVGGDPGGEGVAESHRLADRVGSGLELHRMNHIRSEFANQCGKSARTTFRTES
ncbi:hypothetical protein QPK87_02190 [Kamptonema cortianum]|nr:hypothetical protein [Kamptonema cortianum]